MPETAASDHCRPTGGRMPASSGMEMRHRKSGNTRTARSATGYQRRAISAISMMGTNMRLDDRLTE